MKKRRGESSTPIPLLSWDEFKVLLCSLWQGSEIKPKPSKKDFEPALENAPPTVKPAQSSYSESLFMQKRKLFASTGNKR